MSENRRNLAALLLFFGTIQYQIIPSIFCQEEVSSTVRFRGLYVKLSKFVPISVFTKNNIQIGTYIFVHCIEVYSIINK